VNDLLVIFKLEQTEGRWRATVSDNIRRESVSVALNVKVIDIDRFVGLKGFVSKRDNLKVQVR